MRCYGWFLFASAAGGVYWLKVIHPYESTDNAYLKAHISLISPKETGYVKKVLFDDNRKVSPGQVLVEIDDHDFRAGVARAEAQVLTETARIRTLQTDQLTQKAKIRQQESDMVAADAVGQKSVGGCRHGRWALSLPGLVYGSRLRAVFGKGRSSGLLKLRGLSPCLGRPGFTPSAFVATFPVLYRRIGRCRSS